MPGLLTFKIYDTATPALQRMLRLAPPSRAFFARMGRAAKKLLRQHFVSKDAIPNKKGWPKTHFWSRIRRATNLMTITEDSAQITISDPAFAARLNGATIRPKEKKYLAIPQRAEAYGKRPSSRLIPGLFVIRRSSGGLFLATREDGALRIYYSLVKKAVVPADPTALPEQHVIDAELTRQAEAHFARAGLTI